jgi:hypothetical protein
MIIHSNVHTISDTKQSKAYLLIRNKHQLLNRLAFSRPSLIYDSIFLKTNFPSGGKFVHSRVNHRNAVQNLFCKSHLCSINNFKIFHKMTQRSKAKCMLQCPGVNLLTQGANVWIFTELFTQI